MIHFLALRVIDGKLTLDKVPEKYREEVAAEVERIKNA